MKRSWLFGGILIIGWVLFCRQFPFFWDNILNSKLAQWYLETNFSYLIPPEDMDAGHPPFFNIYLAGCWAVFGKSLAVAHLAMLPFLFGILYQWQKLCRKYLSQKYATWGFLILFLQPTILAQSSMVSPDIALICFFLTALNSELEKKRFVLVLATTGMTLVTFRGILMVPSIFMVGFLLQKDWKNWERTLGRIVWYLPAAVITLTWLLFHWKVQGWLFSPPPETYGGHRELVGIREILRNLGIVGWRFLDHGMVFVWIFFLVALLVRFRKLKADPRFKELSCVFLITTTWLTLLFIPFSNPIGHRYFAVHFLLFCLLAMRCIELVETSWRRWAIPTTIGVGLLSGHFLVYPDQIAQGWDASLAHWSYFHLEEKYPYSTISRLNGITCSDFPLLSSDKYRLVVDQNGTDRYHNIYEVPWEKCTNVVWSNVSNGYSDRQLKELHNEVIWKLVTGGEILGVKLIVYQRR